MNNETSSSNIFDDQQRRNLLLDRSADLQRKKNQSYHGIYPSVVPDSFKEYLSYLDLPRELKYIVLSSSSHYYYEPDELKGVHALLNLKQLNHTPQLDEFLKSIFCILPVTSLLIGCFTDSESQNLFISSPKKTGLKNSEQFDPVEHGIESRIPILNWLYDLIDIRTNRYLTRKLAAFHLEDAYLKVLDMTEINGLTYFCARKDFHLRKIYS